MGNCLKKPQWQLQISFFILRLFFQDTHRLWLYCLHGSPSCKLKDPMCSMCVCVYMYVWVCVCDRDKSFDLISCRLPIPISIFALWKLASVPERHICKWLRELGAPFSAAVQMLHARTIWGGGQRRLRASQFPLTPPYINQRSRGGQPRLTRRRRVTGGNVVTHIIHGNYTILIWLLFDIKNKHQLIWFTRHPIWVVWQHALYWLVSITPHPRMG